MHWRKQFPPKQATVLAEFIAAFRTSFDPEKALAAELPDELPPAPEMSPMPAATVNPVPAAR